MSPYGTAHSNKLENTPIQLNQRYRPRDTGVGYGQSSGYATHRHYVNTSTAHPIRVR